MAAESCATRGWLRDGLRYDTVSPFIFLLQVTKAMRVRYRNTLIDVAVPLQFVVNNLNIPGGRQLEREYTGKIPAASAQVAQIKSLAGVAITIAQVVVVSTLFIRVVEYRSPL